MKNNMEEVISYKVMVIDDDELNLKLFHDLLLQRGYNVKALARSENFVKSIQDFGPDLILMDIQLSETTGIEVIYNVKQNDLLKNIPVIAITAYAEIQDEEYLCKSGFATVLAKPIGMDRFYEALDDCLKEKQ